MIYISEYFFSIQGEGKNAGNPSLFLRVGGCNLQCLGFGKYGCDSNYAVDKKYKSNWKQYQNTKILLDDLLKIAPSDDNYDLVITGGEPTLFYKNSILLEVIEFFISKKIKINIETNATIKIDFNKYPIYKKVTFALSVKLSNSGEPYKKRINKKAIKAIAKHSKNSFLKFVVSKQNIKNNINKEILDIKNFTTIPIYCMPHGSNKNELYLNAKSVFKFCIANGYRYSDRTHIRIYDKKLGV